MIYLCSRFRPYGGDDCMTKLAETIVNIDAKTA